MRSRRSLANCRRRSACRCLAADVARHARQAGLVARISDSTVWRWLHEDAIRPWQHRCWIFPRDPHFQAKVGRILDLYARSWQGKPLREDEFVVSTDEKTSIQARVRIHPTLPTEPGKVMRVEHEYSRAGAWAYLAALDVHRAKIFGRCELITGIAPFERLVEQVMRQSPYKEARRVFWVMDNGSSHRGEASNSAAHPSSSAIGPGPWPGARELAQPNRNLLLSRSTQGAHIERLHQSPSCRRSTRKLRALLREHRSALRVKVHSRRSQCAARTHALTLR